MQLLGIRQLLLLVCWHGRSRNERACTAGIRPKLSGPGEPSADFLFQGHEQHGIEGLINLFGFESPGLTASLAIGEHVVGMAGTGSTE